MSVTSEAGAATVLLKSNAGFQRGLSPAPIASVMIHAPHSRAAFCMRGSL